MKSNSNLKPLVLLPLGDGTYHFNYNITKTFVDVEGSTKKGENYDYDTLHVTNASYSGIVSAMIAEKYSVNDELALHRQREEKVSDFAAYHAYCEACKVIIREAFKNILQNLKALAQNPIDTENFATKDEIKDFVTEQEIIVAVNEAYNEVFE